VRRRFGHLDGAPRVLAFATLITALLVGVHLVPGLVGGLSRWSVLGVALAALAAASRVPAVSGSEPGGTANDVAPPDAAAGDERPVSWLLAGGAAGAMVLWLVASAWNRTVLPPEGVDSLTFHLPNVASWIQSGTFWRIDQFTPLLTNGHYPHNGDVVFLAAVLPWDNDWLAGAVNPLFIGLAGLSVYAIAVRLGAARPPAILAGTLFAAVPAVGLAANGEAMTDSMMLAMFGAGILFLLRTELGAPRSELVLAGLALGLAFGTKWYAAWAVPVVLAVWAAARLVRRGARGEPLARPVRDGALVGGLVLAAGSIWLVRNLVESANPVFPVEVSLLGAVLFDGPPDPIRECAGWTIAHYGGDGGAWSDEILPALGSRLGLPGALIGVGLVAAAILAVRGGRGVPRGALAAGSACAVLLAIGYVLTPYSAFGPEGDPVLAEASVRYLLPALLVAAPLGAVALSRVRGPRPVLEAGVVVAIGFGIERSFEVPFHVVAAVAGVIGCAALAAWAVRAAAVRAGERRGAVLAAAAAVAVAGLVAVGHGRQREFNDGRYERADPAIAWVVRNAQDADRVALAGVWREELPPPVWPAFGERLGTEVRYLGPTVDGMLREYSRRDAWARALRAGGYDLLIVGRGGYSAECPVPGELSDDDRWAREEGLEQLARSDRLTVYRVGAAG
jgi:hypothetical protein